MCNGGIMMFEIKTDTKIEFDYVNWKGVQGHRKVIVDGVWYGSTEYHKTEQLLLEAYDLDKGEFRVFAIKDMSNIQKMK
jgi:predicted DNA-binding transcriptional regulator YafY